MKRKILASGSVFSLIILGSAVLNSCSKANETALQQSGGITCDTVNMKYQADVLPILTAECYSCHSSQTYLSSGSNLNLEDFGILKSEADNGDLLNAIKHTGNVTPMPLNLPQLSDCEINTITDWINNGSKNN
ncbi:hypothetical protein A9P82_03400 [Arachidicoccus ginsenosidimutans]|uniref:hypothetical protein n=1 Tax=Arachidicoccus sp. BS20 TaxID=1850526 RepID=UPI0007F13889|nr:hypothetical protein [Arachidicoccus sp. BS20]ANI88431.1 hypothetical protein A9P82_03400 [Arachidicoccus sp. BS20]